MTSASSPPSTAVTFTDRLLAEALRYLEESAPTSVDETEIATAVQEQGGDFEQRIVYRAGQHPEHEGLREAIEQLRRTLMLSLGITALLALGAGFAAGLSALGSGEQANIFWVLGSLLSLPTLTLVLWCLMWWWQPNTLSSSTLGAGVMGITRRLGNWLHRGHTATATLRASLKVFSSDGLGRWLVSAITHGLWALFLAGCGFMLLAVLALRQYSFYWETTILSEQSYILLTQTLGWLPASLGFSIPSIEQIQSSRWETVVPQSIAIPWSQFLLGSLVVYGVLPRLLLLCLSLLMLRRERRHYRLDTSLPGFERLRPALMPIATPLGVVDPDPGTLPQPEPISTPLERGNGPPALVGLEINLPACGWPIPTEDSPWQDLGILDSREDHHRVLGALQHTDPPPELLVAVCSLTSTPDRGIRNLLIRLADRARAPLALILSDGQLLRDRGQSSAATQRIQQWRTLGENLGIPPERVASIDLNHLTEASEALLGRLIKGEQGIAASSASNSTLGRAFSLIVQHATDWTGPPETTRQAALHQAILELYQGQGQPWPGFIRTQLDPRNLQEDLRGAATQLLDRLPPRLLQSPRWLASGAMTGALSCVAAASLLAPAAITGLPLWAGLGAAIALAIRPNGTEPAPPTPADMGEAVASAALFAVLLDLQGLPEERISQILDALLDEHPPQITDTRAAAQWLDDLQQRLDRLRDEIQPA